MPMSLTKILNAGFLGANLATENARNLESGDHAIPCSSNCSPVGALMNPSVGEVEGGVKVELFRSLEESPARAMGL